MLIRQRTVLALLLRAKKPLNPTAFVKLAFLIRHETDLGSSSAFYDFVPYKYGPFSFTLYRDLANLRRDGYLTPDERCIALCERAADLVEDEVDELPAGFQEAVEKVVRHHGSESLPALLKDVYTRYPWYATKSELTDLRPKSSVCVKTACRAVYTAGYEGKSVDAFFDHLLQSGIRLIIDVRANPVSRRYGFCKRQFSEIAQHLGLDYRHMPDLGIPSKYRVDLTDFDSYQRLLRKYEQEMLPMLEDQIGEAAKLMEETAAVLVCVERDVRCCHRSRLATVISQRTNLEIKHI